MNLISQQEAAAYLNRSPRTLQTWRIEARGPRYYKQGNRVLYKLADIDSWIETTARTSTKEVCRA